MNVTNFIGCTQGITNKNVLAISQKNQSGETKL